jgi:putative oxidoreductase
MQCPTCKCDPCQCKSAFNKKAFGLLVLRVFLGLIFAYHGYGKLFGGAPGMDAFTGMVAGLGFPVAGLFAYIVALTEFFGGIALILGIGTKFVSPVLVITMLVAIFKVKGGISPKSELDVALLGMAIAVGFTGPGKYSLASKLGMGCDEGTGSCFPKQEEAKK